MHCKIGGKKARAGLSMDILASVIAYLGCITAVVAALVISFAAFFSSPEQAPSFPPKQSVAMSAKPSVPKVTTAAVAKPPVKLDQAQNNSSTIAQRIARTKAAAAHTRTLAARAEKVRHLVQEERARRWAYQDDPDFEARFLGYTD